MEAYKLYTALVALGEKFGSKMHDFDDFCGHIW